MNRARRLLTTIALASAIALTAAACHKKIATAPPAPPPPPPVAPAPPPPPPPPAPPRAVPAPPPSPLTEDQIFAQKSLDQLNAERPLDDVFFDFNESEIREDGKAPLQKDAVWLKRWASTSINVEGHCDSRGSSEYNLALGSRRASAVKDYLANLGVPIGRIMIISKGKEQPFCNEENESCWQQNRRGHFIVTAK
jgi:peptidoglycan-associated lipoprotein